MKRVVLILIFSICLCACEREKTIERCDFPAILPNVTELADTILEKVNFPAMITYTEQSDIEAILPDINFDDIEEIVLIQQAMTVHLIELIIIRPAFAKTNDAVNFLQERQKVLREQLAFYPAQVLSAEASIVGRTEAFAYLICHEDAAEIEILLLNLIEELTITIIEP